jgi:hypothetical protein
MAVREPVKFNKGEKRYLGDATIQTPWAQVYHQLLCGAQGEQGLGPGAAVVEEVLLLRGTVGAVVAGDDCGHRDLQLQLRAHPAVHQPLAEAPPPSTSLNATPTGNFGTEKGTTSHPW